MTPTPSSSAPNPTLQIWQGCVKILTSDTSQYLLKRFLQAVLTLLLATALSFFIIQLAPGDFLAAQKLNPAVSPETIQQMEAQFGLDRPLWEQYFRWLWQIVRHLNFGQSFTYQKPVAEILWERVPNTLLLSLSSIIVTWAVAIPLGIYSAVRQHHVSDKILRIISYIGQGFPTVITGLLLLILAQYTVPLFPVGGRTSINHENFTWFGKMLDIGWHLILPTLALSITSFAGLQRIMRGQLLDVLRQDYIQTARAKGLPENRVIYVHALRNAVNPLVTILGFTFADLLAGSFIIETFFSWPGLGKLLIQAVQAQDLYLVMGGLVMGGVMLIVGNLLADLLLTVVDPRIKLSEIN